MFKSIRIALIAALLLISTVIVGSGVSAQTDNCSQVLREVAALLARAETAFTADDLNEGKSLVAAAVTALRPCRASTVCPAAGQALVILEAIAVTEEAEPVNALLAGAKAILATCGFSVDAAAGTPTAASGEATPTVRPTRTPRGGSSASATPENAATATIRPTRTPRVAAVTPTRTVPASATPRPSRTPRVAPTRTPRAGAATATPRPSRTPRVAPTRTPRTTAATATPRPSRTPRVAPTRTPRTAPTTSSNTAPLPAGDLTETFEAGSGKYTIGYPEGWTIRDLGSNDEETAYTLIIGNSTTSITRLLARLISPTFSPVMTVRGQYGIVVRVFDFGRDHNADAAQLLRIYMASTNAFTDEEYTRIVEDTVNDVDIASTTVTALDAQIIVVVLDDTQFAVLEAYADNGTTLRNNSDFLGTVAASVALE